MRSRASRRSRVLAAVAAPLALAALLSGCGSAGSGEKRGPGSAPAGGSGGSPTATGGAGAGGATASGGATSGGSASGGTSSGGATTGGSSTSGGAWVGTDTPYTSSCEEQVCTAEETCADGPDGTYCVHPCPGQPCPAGQTSFCDRQGGIICVAG